MQNQPKLVNIQQKNVQTSITPHPFTYEAVNSLRSKSKPLKHMICELLDNALDAEADEFHVNIIGDSEKKNSKVKEIIVSDNGLGMTESLLEGSFAIGRTQGPQHRSAARQGEHGKYGLGGTLYSLVHFNEKETFTSQKLGELYRRRYSMSEVKERDQWHSIAEPLTARDRAFWEKSGLPNPGTIIRLTNPLPNRAINKDRAVSTIKTRLGYRYYSDIIRKTIKILVNGEEVQAKCPVMSTHKHVKQSSKDIIINGVHVCTVTCYNLSDVANLEGVDKNNMANAGIYARRENALVTERPFWFGEKGLPAGDISAKRQNDSKTRIMIEFTAEQDDLMGIDNAKDDLEINQAVADAIYEFLKPRVLAERNRANNKTAASSKKTTDRIGKEISTVSDIPAIRPKKGPGSKKGRVYEMTGKYKGQEKNLPFVSELKVEAYGLDPVYRVTPDGELRINTEHPFFQEYMKGLTEKQLKAFAVFFVCLGATETESRLGQIDDVECTQTKRVMIDYFINTLDKKLRFSDC